MSVRGQTNFIITSGTLSPFEIWEKEIFNIQKNVKLNKKIIDEHVIDVKKQFFARIIKCKLIYDSYLGKEERRKKKQKAKE